MGLLTALGSLGCAGTELGLAPSVPRFARARERVASHQQASVRADSVGSLPDDPAPRSEVAVDSSGPPSDRTGPDLRCPPETALVEDRVCVDRWEGSILEQTSSGMLIPWSPYLPIDGIEARMRAVSRPGVIPQGYISGKQASLACRASGKRLCTPDEWEHACRGSSGFRFPYGDTRRPGVCNDDIRRVHPVPEAAMLLGIPRERLWYDGMNQSIINQLDGTVLPTGERSGCTNAFGVFDMVGNLHEWVGDPAGTFRGGYFMDTTKNGDGCSYRTTAHDFTYHDYSTGFRCCMSPEIVQ